MPNRIHGAWYALVAVPIAIGAAIAVWLGLRMLDDIEAMPRLSVPGERDVELHAGHHVVYLESSSVVEGRRISVPGFEASCGLRNSLDLPVELHTSSSSTEYKIGDYSGKSAASFDLAFDGTYHLSCTGGPGVVAIGSGLFGSITYLVVSIVLSILVSIVVFSVIRRRRKGA